MKAKILQTKVLLLIILNMLSYNVLANKRRGIKSVPISSEIFSINFPPKQRVNTDTLSKLKKLPVSEVLPVLSLKNELEAYVLEKQKEKFISNNVVVDVDMTVEEENLKGTYSYSLVNDTLVLFTDDFSLGRYKISDSNALFTTLEFIKHTIDNQLKKYINTDRRIQFTITGCADAIPIKGKIPYKGEFGSSITETYQNGKTENQAAIDVINGLSDNEALAFLRSYAVRDYLMHSVPMLQNTRNEYHHVAVVSDQQGAQFRRVTIEMIIYNAFR